jgi:glutaredoxin-like protein
MPLLSEQDSEFLKKDFNEKLKNNVKLIFFKAEDACLYCKEVKDILAEVAGLSDKLSLEEYDFDKDTDKVKLYGIKRTPAIVIEGDKDYGVRFYGMPAGHEFMTLVNGIINVSTKETGLSEKTVEKLKEITKPYNIQVFVTPT